MLFVPVAIAITASCVMGMAIGAAYPEAVSVAWKIANNPWFTPKKKEKVEPSVEKGGE